VSAASISADTKDALARDVPEGEHCRNALRAGLALYGANPRSTHFITHRNTVGPALLEPARRPQDPSDRAASGDSPPASSDVCDRTARAAANGAEKTRSEVRPLDRDPRRVSRVRFRRGRYARIPPRIRASRRRDGRASGVDAAQHRPHGKDDDAKDAPAVVLQRFRRHRGRAHHDRGVRPPCCTSKTCAPCAKPRTAFTGSSTPSGKPRNAPRKLPPSSAGSSSTSRARTDSRSSRRHCARSRSCASRIPTNRSRNWDGAANPAIAKPTVGSRLAALGRLASKLRQGQRQAHR